MKVTPTSIYEWLKAWSNLAQLIRGLETKYKFASYADLTNVLAKEEFDRYITELLPRAEEDFAFLRKKFFEYARGQDLLADPFYSEIVKTFGAQLTILTENNTDHIAKQAVLSEEFSRIVTARQVRIDGKQLSIGEVNNLIEGMDRDLREKAWVAKWDSLLAYETEIDEVFIDLVGLRHKIAKGAGLASFTDYKWLELERFDYTPQDNLMLVDALEQHVLPLFKRVQEVRKRLLRVDTLRPWDTQVYPFDEPLQSPFSNPSDLLESANELIAKISPEMASLLENMRQSGKVDLEIRDNKYLTDIADYDYINKTPKIFTYASGSVYDLNYLIHEFGHAYHFELTMEQPLYWLQWGKLEVMELAAQTLELLKLPYLKDFLGEDSAQKVAFLTYEKILTDLAMVPVLELFQQWVYSQKPEMLNPDELDKKFLELATRFSADVDWSGLEQYLSKGWYYKHLFQLPFYFVEYAYAWVGALDIFERYLVNPQAALDKFEDALKLGASVPVPEIYKRAGGTFPASTKNVKTMVNFIESQLPYL